MKTESPRLSSPVILTPDGEFVPVTKELFSAVQEFMKEKKNGHIQINFSQGAIASVEGAFRKIYPKNGNGRH